MSDNTGITAEENKAHRTEILNSIFDMLVETTGLHGGADDDLASYHRKEFLHMQLRDEYYFAFEYWFPANASDNMKLLFSDFDGFSVITQDRTKKGIAAAELANARLVEMGYHR